MSVGSDAGKNIAEGAVEASELEQGTRVELIGPVGGREAGAQGAVVHACTAVVMVQFDHADRYGARQEVLERALLRRIDGATAPA
jgi:hypothetical protein